MCDKNYTHCKNQSDDCDSETDVTDKASNDQTRKKTKAKAKIYSKNQSNSIEERSHDFHVFEQPQLLNPHSQTCHCQTCNPSSNFDSQITIDPSYLHNPNSRVGPYTSNTKVSFKNHPSTLPPSFNISSHKKSTPIRQNNKNENFSQTTQTPYKTPNETVVTIEPNSNLDNDEIQSDETLC